MPNSECDADAGTGWREYRRIDPNNLTERIKQRSTGIAAINRGVGLDVIDIGAGLDPVSTNGRDNPDAGGLPNAKWVSDCNDPIPHPNGITVIKPDTGKILGA